MARVRFIGSATHAHYSGRTAFGRVDGWPRGEERTIPDAFGEYLVGKLPSLFEEVPSGTPALADAPPSVLRLSVPKLEAALASGAHDDELSSLLAAEKAGKGRVTAIEAIEGRIRDVSEG